jgi:two-component system cell cycle sensor histidine kinase/response regulator CckA
MGLVHVDRDGHVIGLDATAGRLLGRQAARPHGELIPAAESWLLMVRHVIDHDAVIGDVEVPGHPGLRGRLQAVPSCSGAPQLAVIVLVDQVPSTSQLSTSRYELATQATHDAIWEWDVVERRAWWNDQQYLVFGYKPGEVEPSFDAWTARIHPEDRARVLDGFASALASTRSMWKETYRFTRLDGSVRYGIDCGVIERNSDGTPLRMVGSMHDVTEPLMTERALRESEALFRQLTDAIPEVFWLAEPDASRILYVSPAWEAVWGVSCQAVMDDPSVLFESIHPEDRARVATAIREKVDTFDETYRIVRPDGRIVWIRDRGYPIRDADGKLVRVAGLATDVTAERALEERLQQASKLESIGRLAGGLAHDFNNMLSVILSASEAGVCRLPSGHPAHVDFADVREAAQRAAEITRQLMIFTRQHAVLPSLVDLNQLTTRLEGMLRRLLGESVRLVFRLADEPMVTWIDGAQMEQVLVNLAINARDAMPGGGALTIESGSIRLGGGAAQERWDVAAGDYVLLAVRDTGTGMSPEAQAHIFEPFFTTKETGHGTGLGLSTCYGVVRKAGGDIRVSTELGRGTAFEIVLPARSATKLSVAAMPVMQQPGGNETILFVEDQTPLRSVAVRILREAGYDVLSATDGAEALSVASARQGHIELLVTDVVMPHMNGVDLASQLCAERAGMRVLFCSGYPNDALPARGRPDSGAAFLAKPYQASTLLRTVRAVLDDR